MRRLPTGLPNLLIPASGHPQPRQVMDGAWIPLFIKADVWRRAHYFSRTRKVTEYLEAHVGETTDLRTMACVACMERTAFSRAFRRMTGMSFREFAKAYRVSIAVTKMKSSDQSITELAFELGFGSVVTFERTFKKILGQTPSSYRAQLLQLSRSLRSDCQ